MRDFQLGFEAQSESLDEITSANISFTMEVLQKYSNAQNRVNKLLAGIRFGVICRALIMRKFSFIC